jgi:aldehyde dehydrogenase
MTKVDLNIALKSPFAKRYDNYIGGEWRAPKAGKYFNNVSPITGQPVCEIARSDASDVEAALDAAHAAKEAWGRTSPAERAQILLKIADRMDANLEKLALAETWDNGKPIRESTAADIPLAIDHFRYFASAIRAQEGSISEIDHDTVAYHFHEPLGVVGQIIPWNFPILMACWKLAPALAAGNCVVLKPAEQTPASIMVWLELVGDLLPKGVLNVVSGFGLEAGKPLASSNRIAKIAFTGETTTGRLIMQYASQNLIPVTLELGGKSPNIFFDDVAAKDDDFFDKAIGPCRLGDHVQDRRGGALDRQRHGSMASAPACGAATPIAATASGARSWPGACGPIATTPIPRMRRSAATSNRASAARTIR